MPCSTQTNNSYIYDYHNCLSLVYTKNNTLNCKELDIEIFHMSHKNEKTSCNMMRFSHKLQLYDQCQSTSKHCHT